MIITNHLEAAEVIARLLYDGDRRFALSKEEMTALEWAIRTMRRIAKEKAEKYFKKERQNDGTTGQPIYSQN